MKRTSKLLLLISSLCLAASAIVSAQDSTGAGVRTSIGLGVGYALPAGDWTKSRIAPDIQMFSGGFTFGGDITIRLAQRWGLVLAAGYSTLSGSEWEEYAYLKGDGVSVSASVTDVSISLRPYLIASPHDQLSLEFGAVGLFAGGHEVVNGERYEYDFFSSFRLGFQGAVEYDRLVSEGIAVTIRGGAVVAPDGMNYADGESRTIVYFPVTVGIRFLL